MRDILWLSGVKQCVWCYLPVLNLVLVDRQVGAADHFIAGHQPVEQKSGGTSGCDGAT